MIEHAFVQEQGRGQLSPELKDARAALVSRGIAVTLFLRRQMERRQLPLSPRTLVVGDVATVEAALRQLGIEPPPDDSYPEPLLNDGYGLGNYGLAPDLYLDLCIARWEQLTA